MPGRRPIFATLVSGFFTSLRDVLYKAVLEPASPEKRQKREQANTNKKK